MEGSAAVRFLNKILSGQNSLKLDILTFPEFQQLFIHQNASRRDDEGNESSKRGELIALYHDRYREDSARYRVVGIRALGQVAGCCAFGVTTNAKKNPPRRSYARVDIVITRRDFRRLNLAKLMVYATLDLILKQWGRELYSISCLCAHRAMSRIFESLGGFTLVRDERKGTLDAIFEVNNASVYRLRQSLNDLLLQTARTVLYHYRQNKH